MVVWTVADCDLIQIRYLIGQFGLFSNIFELLSVELFSATAKVQKKKNKKKLAADKLIFYILFWLEIKLHMNKYVYCGRMPLAANSGQIMRGKYKK